MRKDTTKKRIKRIEDAETGAIIIAPKPKESPDSVYHPLKSKIKKASTQKKN